MIPTLPHLQAAVLQQLHSELSGENLRSALEAVGIHKSGPGFYQLMQRIEEAGFIESKKVPVVIHDQTYHERHYRITAKGRKALKQVEEFYAA